jgi:hypothetical protein
LSRGRVKARLISKLENRLSNRKAKYFALARYDPDRLDNGLGTIVDRLHLAVESEQLRLEQGSVACWENIVREIEEELKPALGRPQVEKSMTLGAHASSDKYRRRAENVRRAVASFESPQYNGAMIEASQNTALNISSLIAAEASALNNETLERRYSL